MGILLLFLVFAFAVGIVVILVYSGLRGSSGPRYQGAAPHKGKVMRFTGMSSEVKEDDGKQSRTEV